MGAGVLTPAPTAWPVPDALARRDGVLHCEAVPLPVIVAEVGLRRYLGRIRVNRV